MIYHNILHICQYGNKGKWKASSLAKPHGGTLCRGPGSRGTITWGGRLTRNTRAYIYDPGFRFRGPPPPRMGWVHPGEGKKQYVSLCRSLTTRITCIHTYIHTDYTYTHTYLQTNTYIHPYMHVHTDTPPHPQGGAGHTIHTHIHTYIQIHTYTIPFGGGGVGPADLDHIYDLH